MVVIRMEGNNSDSCPILISQVVDAYALQVENLSSSSLSSVVSVNPSVMRAIDYYATLMRRSPHGMKASSCLQRIDTQRVG